MWERNSLRFCPGSVSNQKIGPSSQFNYNRNVSLYLTQFQLKVAVHRFRATLNQEFCILSSHELQLKTIWLKHFVKQNGGRPRRRDQNAARMLVRARHLVLRLRGTTFLFAGTVHTRSEILREIEDLHFLAVQVLIWQGLLGRKCMVAMVGSSCRFHVVMLLGSWAVWEGRHKATWKRKFKLPWRKAGLLKSCRWFSGPGPVGSQ